MYRKQNLSYLRHQLTTLDPLRPDELEGGYYPVGEPTLQLLLLVPHLVHKLSFWIITEYEITSVQCMHGCRFMLNDLNPPPVPAVSFRAIVLGEHSYTRIMHTQLESLNVTLEILSVR